MNIREALKELRLICNNEYCNIKESITINPHHGTEDVECTVYVHGYNHITGPSWVSALAQMEEKIRASKCPECYAVIVGSICQCKQPEVV